MLISKTIGHHLCLLTHCIEAKRIQTLVDRLHESLALEHYYEKLKLPEGNYERDGIPGIRIGSTVND